MGLLLNIIYLLIAGIVEKIQINNYRLPPDTLKCIEARKEGQRKLDELQKRGGAQIIEPVSTISEDKLRIEKEKLEIEKMLKDDALYRERTIKEFQDLEAQSDQSDWESI